MDGIINLNKPAGLSSHGAVAAVRRLFPGVRAGHGGTLDPAATGVLPIGLGRATRGLEYLVEQRKGYRAAIELGVITSTGDAEGEVLCRQPVPPFEREKIEAVLQALVGLQQQRTPPYSAAKHRGRPLYEYARRGESVPVKMRTVEIYRLELLAYSYDRVPQLLCEMECSRGTYVRELAQEIGRRLGCGAHLHRLERFFVGPFHIDSAASLDELEEAAAAGRLGEMVLPMDRALLHFDALTIPGSAVEDLRMGRSVPWSRLEEAGLQSPPHRTPLLRIYDPGGNFKALARLCGVKRKLALKTVKFLAPS